MLITKKNLLNIANSITVDILQKDMYSNGATLVQNCLDL